VVKAILIVSVIAGSWLGMQAVHECGHILAAKISGAVVTNVALHPLGLSRTDVAESTSPLFVVWAGPLFGVAMPLLFWAVAALLKLRGAFVFRFFAGFCLIANGLYLGLGSFDQVGDCGEMLRFGSTLWQLWVFAALTVPVGFFLWHGQSGHFGFGPRKREVDGGVACGTAVVCVALVVIGVIVGE
jgi:hypothetical protein